MEEKKWDPGHRELLNKFNSCPKTGDLNKCTLNFYYLTHPSYPSSLQEDQFQWKKSGLEGCYSPFCIYS